MEVIYNGQTVELQKKERRIGGEAPSVRVKMISADQKVIGMMADKVQVMITLPYGNSFSNELYEIVNKHKEKAYIYFFSPEAFTKDVDDGFATIDFETFCTKFGVLIDPTICAKSAFVIDKEGEIVYIQIPKDLDDEFNLEELDTKIQEAIDFKRKGHTHENWMGV
jgi:thiol peroxidase